MLRSEIERFISEDLGEWDESSTIVPEVEIAASIFVREDCVISGLEEVVKILDFFGLESEPLYHDGDDVPSGSIVVIIQGSARKILQAERVVLNFMARMSGISTLTRRCVLKGRGVRVACTRKTTPGFRIYEKKAVFIGGGDTHRFNLSDSVLIKDNHLKVMDLKDCVEKARKQASFTKKIEVEVEDLDSMAEAAELGVDIIMFDNMSPGDIKKGVNILEHLGQRESIILEASGNITLENIEDYASTGVDVVSMGALTRNAKWIDVSLKIN